MVEDYPAMERALVGAIFRSDRALKEALLLFDAGGYWSFLDHRHADICAAAEYIICDWRDSSAAKTGTA